MLKLYQTIFILISMEEEEKIKDRFSEEIKAIGMSKNAIAQEIGFSAQTFTNVTSGRNLPGTLLLNRLQKRFPEFDINYVVSGIRTGEDSQRVQELVKEVDFQRAIVSGLLGKDEVAILCPGLESDFRYYSATQATYAARNSDKKKKSISTPGRGQGTMIPNVMNDVRAILG